MLGVKYPAYVRLTAEEEVFSYQLAVFAIISNRPEKKKGPEAPYDKFW